jgi:hypothetical protein
VSAHPVTAPADPLIDLVRRHLRSPSNVTGDPATGALTLHFVPDLTAAEVTTLARIDAIARGGRSLTPTDWAAIEPRLTAIRTYRQQSQAEFMAKTATQRDRELFDLGNDLAAVVLRLLRDA